MVELLLLRGIEILLASCEIGAGIDHVAVEPEPIEIVGDVGVVTYGRSVGGRSVAVAAYYARQNAQRR